MTTGPTSIRLSAVPEPLILAPRATALVVVDMQNAYCSEGGYFSHLGVDLSPAARIIPIIAELAKTAAAAGLTVVWLQNGWDPALKEAGGPGSVNQRKGNALRLMRERPELAGTLLTKGGRDFALVDGLVPGPDDLVIAKPRYSGFAGTALDSMLRSRRIETLIVCGVATNVCVESTIRDAFFLEYHPVLVRDACYQAGPDHLQAATIYNVERFFGWTASASGVIASLAPALAA